MSIDVRRVVAGLLSVAAALAGCGGSDEAISPAPRARLPAVRDVRRIVPFEAPPAGVAVQNANNNLDVVRHEGRVFLAFRTAPSHFASEKTVLYVVSSDDERTWTLETSVAMGTDLREPRFLSFGGKLFLYFAVLGKSSVDFEPGETRVTAYEGPGRWTEPETMYEKGFIPWRAKTIGGRAYLVGYVGGENIYDLNGEPIRIHFLTTEDGLSWTPVVPGQPVVQEGGGSETDFVLLDDGSLVAVTRNEAGDELGWGSKICRAPADDLGSWECVPDPKKYDSPLLFRHGSDVWLVGRRNLTETGNYDLGLRDLSHADQTQTYLVEYAFSPKRCSLWKVDPAGLSVSFELDLPSRGDTCFASALEAGDDTYAIYNYTNDYTGEDELDWIQGQGLPTLIYRALVEMPRSP